MLEHGDELPADPELLFARLAGAARLRLARARARPPPGHAGLPQARRRAPTQRLGRALAVVRRPAHRRLRRPRGPRRREAARLRDEDRRRASRATTSSSPSAATTGSTSRTSRSARSRATSAPTRRRPRSPSSAARPGDLLKTRARESVRELAGELIALYARRQQAPGHRLRPRRRAGRAARGRVPVPRDGGPARARSRRSRRTSRRRGRWTGSSAATSASARPRSPCARPSRSRVNGRQTLMLVPTTVLAEQHWNTFRERYRDFPVRVEMVSRFRKPADDEEGARRLRRRARSTC